MDKKPFFTKREIIISILLGIFAISFSYVQLYFDKKLEFTCEYGKKEVYYKSNLSEYKLLCGKPNPYIYNDNTGFGIFFPNKRTKDYINELNNLKKIDINFSRNYS